MNHEGTKDWAKGMEKARGFITKYGHTWPQAAEESIDELTTDRFQVYVYGFAALLDPEGKVVEVNPHGERLAKALERLLGDKASADTNPEKPNVK